MDDAARSSGPLHQTGALPLADGDTGDAALCVTSPDQQHVYLSRRLETHPRNEASPDFEKHSCKRLKSGRRLKVEKGRSSRASAAHHEGNRSHPSWSMWKSDWGEGINIVVCSLERSTNGGI